MSPFRAPNMLLHNKWKKEDIRRHQEKLMTSRTALDTKSPSRFLHLAIDLKRMQKEEEYQATVDYENRILLQKLSSIMRNPCRLDNWNDYERKCHRSLNSEYRERMQRDRARENRKIVQRLSNVKPMYDVCALEDDFQRHKYMKNLLADSTKDFDINGPRKTRETESRHASRLSPLQEGQSQSTFGSQQAVRSDTQMKGEEGDETRTLAQTEEAQKAPKPKPKSKLKKTSVQTMAENDAKLLNKVIQTQSQPNDIYIRTLVRRKHLQRLKTKRKYRDLYDADLETKLREALPRSYDSITEVLLAEADTLFLRRARSAIEEVNVQELIDTIMLFDSEDFSHFAAAYKRKFKVTLAKDIEDHFEDEIFVAFMQTFVEATNGDQTPDSMRALELVEELEADEDPFYKDGTIMRALREHGPTQLKFMDKHSLETRDKPLADLLSEKSNDKKAIDALSIVVDNLNNGAHMKNRARFLYSNMGADSKPFIQELTALSEIGVLDQVQKEYRKNYKTPLIDDIAKRCRGESVGVIMAMAENKSRPLGKTQKDRGKIEIVNAPRKVAPPERYSTIDSNNPLNRPSHRYYADVAQYNYRQFRSRQAVAPSVQGSSSKQAVQPSGTSSQEGTTNLRLLVDRSKEGESKKAGTVQPKPGFNPVEEANRAHASINDTNSPDLGLQLSESSNSQRQTLRTKYKEFHDQDLLTSAVEVAPSAEWRNLFTFLLTSTSESIVDIVRADLTSQMSIATLVAMNEKELGSFSQKYKESSGGNELSEDLTGHSDFGKLLNERLTGKKEKSFAVNEEAVLKDAEHLNTLESPISLTNDEFSRLMKKSSVHIGQTFEKLGKMRDKGVGEVINELFDFVNSAPLYCLVQSLGNSNVVFCKMLSQSLENHDHDLLISIIVTRSEIDLAKIKSVYAKIHGTKLYEDVKENLGTADWKETLLNIIKE